MKALSIRNLQVAEAQAARRAERENLTTGSRMRGRPKGEETKPRAKKMGPPKELSEEDKARRQERQVGWSGVRRGPGGGQGWGGM